MLRLSLRWLILSVVSCIPAFGLVRAQSTPPQLTFKELHHDFGEIIRPRRQTFRYTFENKGTEPLQIADVKTGCGCIDAQWSTSPVAPGEQGFVELSFNSRDKLGHQHRTVNVIVLGAEDPIPLTLDADVLMEDGLPAIDLPGETTPTLPNQRIEQDAGSTQEVVFEELEANFGELVQGKIAYYSFSFQNVGSESVKIVDLVASCDAIDGVVNGQSIAPNAWGHIETTFQTSGRLGPQQHTLQVNFEGGNPPPITVTIKAIIVRKP